MAGVRPSLLTRTCHLLFLATSIAAAEPAETGGSSAEKTLRQIYAEALARGQAFENLRSLVTQHPGRLSGSKSLEGAVQWAEKTLTGLGLDRVYTQSVLVPHWERGQKESVVMMTPAGATPLAALALGGSGATAGTGLLAEVIEVQSLDEVVTLGHAKVAGKIVFYNRPMDPRHVRPGDAYREAGDQRSRGPAHAARYGAAGVLTRSLTHALDDRPHTGVTIFPAGQARLPCAALSTLAADKLSAAIAAAAKAGDTVRIAMTIAARLLPDAPSHNVIGEIRGTTSPEEIILVGGHLDSWDVAPGAHDDGAGVVQSIEVLRIFRALGLEPRHTLRCVLFTNEENGSRGSTVYVSGVKEKGEKHVLAVETDSGGFQPRGFNLGSTQGPVHERAAEKWRALFEPFGVTSFVKGAGGADVGPLMAQGVTVAGLAPDSQRYFDVHHTTADSLDTVNPRELHLGAAALAALIWLVDTQGL